MKRPWDIERVRLEAFEDPVEQWANDLARVASTLARTDCHFSTWCGVALGTDLNGMAPGIPGTIFSPYDPKRPGFVLQYPDGLGSKPKIEGVFKTRNRIWDVTKDGIAHVGLLPDFLVAAAHVDAEAVAMIFHSAGDFVMMWEKLEPKKTAGADSGAP